MGLQKFQIMFDNPNNIYFCGQTVSGRLLVVTDTPKNLRSIKIKLKGEANVHWTESRTEHRDGKSHTHTVHFNGHELYFENNVTLFGGHGDTVTLPPGQYSYPFSMVLPNHLPSSFEGQYGYIRYTVKATMDRPWKFDHESKAVYTVLSHVDLNLDPRNREPVRLEKEKHFCCCCCKSGPLALVSLLPARGFVPGQVVPVTVEVDNASNVDIDEVVVELQKYVAFHATSPRKSRHEHVTISKLVLEGEVNANDSKTWSQTFTIPSLPPSQLRECNIIDLEYKLKIKAKPEGMHSDLVNEIPITIGTIPLWEGQPAPFAPMPGAPMPGFPMPGVQMPGGPVQPMPMPSAPPSDIGAGEVPNSPYPNLPPPSYQECMFGTNSIGDSDDNEHVYGITSYNPRYPTYNLPTPPPAYPGVGWSAPPELPGK